MPDFHRVVLQALGNLLEKAVRDDFLDFFGFPVGDGPQNLENQRFLRVFQGFLLDCALEKRKSVQRKEGFRDNREIFRVIHEDIGKCQQSRVENIAFMRDRLGNIQQNVEIFENLGENVRKPVILWGFSRKIVRKTRTVSNFTGGVVSVACKYRIQKFFNWM